MTGRRGTATARASERCRRLVAAAFILCAGVGSGGAGSAGAGAADADAPDKGVVELQIVGGLAGVTQYTRFEQPFWENEIYVRSKGRIAATIRPLDGGGVRAKEMLQLLRLGVVPFGTAVLTVTAGDEPELNAVDLPVLNPDIATLRRTVVAFREHMRAMLLERYGIELLGVYAYPAQVLFCRKPFSGLDDLAGRKVRTSSVGQSELMTALGAIPVLLPFSETLPALRDGVAECAITGTLSGYEIRLPGIATHIHTMAISWGISVFAANASAWAALPADVRTQVREGVADLERRIWLQAEVDTARGLDCSTGAATCDPAPDRPMARVETSAADAARRQRLLTEVVIPRWIERCGEECVNAWNTYLAPIHGLPAEPR